MRTHARHTPCLQVEAQMSDILATCFVNNPANNIGGTIWCNPLTRHIMQELEGPEQHVLDLFARIKQDPRHTNVTQLACVPIKSRAHPWFGMVRGIGADWKVLGHNEEGVVAREFSLLWMPSPRRDQAESPSSTDSFTDSAGSVSPSSDNGTFMHQDSRSLSPLLKSPLVPAGARYSRSVLALVSEQEGESCCTTPGATRHHLRTPPRKGVLTKLRQDCISRTLGMDTMDLTSAAADLTASSQPQLKSHAYWGQRCAAADHDEDDADGYSADVDGS